MANFGAGHNLIYVCCAFLTESAEYEKNVEGQLRHQSRRLQLEILVNAEAVLFHVRLQPRSSRDAVAGKHAGALQVRLTATPGEGRVNESLRRLWAERLNVPLSAVRIVSGENSRNKRIAVAGVLSAQALALCSPAAHH